MNNSEIELPPNATALSPEVIEFLKKIGIIYEDSCGVHVVER